MNQLQKNIVDISDMIDNINADIVLMENLMGSYIESSKSASDYECHELNNDIQDLEKRIEFAFNFKKKLESKLNHLIAYEDSLVSSYSETNSLAMEYQKYKNGD